MIQIIPEMSFSSFFFTALSPSNYINLWVQICVAVVTFIFTTVLAAFTYNLCCQCYYSIYYTVAHPMISATSKSLAFPVIGFPSFAKMSTSTQDFFADIPGNQSHCSGTYGNSFHQSIKQYLSILKNSIQSKPKMPPKMPDFYILKDPCSTRMVAEAEQHQKLLEQQYVALQQKVYDNSPIVIAKTAIVSTITSFIPSFGLVQVLLNSKPQIDGFHAVSEWPLHSFSKPVEKSCTPVFDRKGKGKGKPILDIPDWPLDTVAIQKPKETTYIATEYTTKVLLEQPYVAPIAQKVNLDIESAKPTIVESAKQYPNADNLFDHLPQILLVPLRMTEYTFDSATTITAAGIKFAFRL
jgi:hypothetical protein